MICDLYELLRQRWPARNQHVRKLVCRERVARCVPHRHKATGLIACSKHVRRCVPTDATICQSRLKYGPRTAASTECAALECLPMGEPDALIPVGTRPNANDAEVCGQEEWSLSQRNAGHCV
eukprot:7384705-Prymnesium_polylepis.1